MGIGESHIGFGRPCMNLRRSHFGKRKSMMGIGESHIGSRQSYIRPGRSQSQLQQSKVLFLKENPGRRSFRKICGLGTSLLAANE